MITKGEVGNSRVAHQEHEVEHILHPVSQIDEGLDELLLKLLVVGAIRSSQCLNHHTVNPNLGRHIGLKIIRLFAKDEAEINVEVESIYIDHDVFQMSVSDTKEVCCRAIPSK